MTEYYGLAGNVSRTTGQHDARQRSRGDGQSSVGDASANRDAQGSSQAGDVNVVRRDCTDQYSNIKRMR